MLVCRAVLIGAVSCRAVLNCAVLCRAVLSFAVLCRAVLHCAVLCRAVLSCAVLCRAVLNGAVLCCAGELRERPGKQGRDVACSCGRERVVAGLLRNPRIGDRSVQGNL